ncbi:MAG: hypothetical protein AAB488_00410 [Patescibacteria group bacterium]
MENFKSGLRRFRKKPNGFCLADSRKAGFTDHNGTILHEAKINANKKPPGANYGRR